MTGDIVQMGAYIGAGLACIGMGGAALGVGNVVGNFLSGALRNPSLLAAKLQRCSLVLRSQKLWGSSHSSSLCC